MRSNIGLNALRITTSLLSAGLIFIGLSLNLAHAQQADSTDWWFDVEVLVFKYNNASEDVSERFSPIIDLELERADERLFVASLLPDLRWVYLSLPICQEAQDRLDVLCRPPQMPLEPIDVPQLTLESISEIPVVMDGVVIPYPETMHFLPDSARELLELYKNIRWDKSTTVLLHSAWRQPVMVGEENAQPIRLLAGQNLTYVAAQDTQDNVDESHEETTDNNLQQVDLVSQIRTNLDSPNPVVYPDQIVEATEVEYTQAQFELDGLFNVFIRYVNGVPYLHIDAHLGFFTLEDGLLFPHEFKQRRRIISQQVHYFDHPYFGMIVELRRYKRPVKEVPIEHEDLY